MAQSLNEIRSLAGLSVNEDTNASLIQEAKISYAGKHMLVLLQDAADLAVSGPAELVVAWLINEVKESTADEDDETTNKEVEKWAKALASGDVQKAESLYQGWSFGIGEIVVQPMTKVATVDN